MIAGNTIFSFDPSSILLQSVAMHASEAIINHDDRSKKSTLTRLGSAPNVKIYALRVFNNIPFPADSSEMLDAVNRVIELRVEGLDIGVVNMSLGRRSLFAGRGIFEEMVDELLEVGIGNGTSFSTPLVSGVAALLRHAFPGADATQIRNAILLSDSSEVTEDGSTELDEGQGWVDAQAAFELLEGNGVSHLLDRPFRPRNSVAENVKRGTELEVSRGSAGLEAQDLKPGERFDILLEIPANAQDVTITISDVDAEFLPSEFFGDCGPEKQNCFFVGDAIMLNIHSAKTSSIQTATSAGDYFDLNSDPSSVSAFIVENQEVTIIIADRDSKAVYDPTALVIRDDLEPGIVRVTVAGDVVNAGPISANVAVTTSRLRRPRPTLEGAIDDFELIQPPDPTPVPPDVDQVQFRLKWNGDSFDFSGGGVPQEFTLDSPEVVRVNDPPAGLYFIDIFGFEVNTGSDEWELRVTADGERLEFLSPTSNDD